MLAQKVAAFRRGLDVDMDEEQSYLDSINEKRELFDLGSPTSFTERCSARSKSLISDKRNLIVVPFGPLTALPFHLLVLRRRASPSRPEQPSPPKHGAIATPPGS